MKYFKKIVKQKILNRARASRIVKKRCFCYTEEMVNELFASVDKIVIAAILGAILGAEREYSGRAAGLRTNMLIAVSSCLFTLLSVQGFGDSDGARVASQIVTGVGFLGAGALIHNHNQVIGLTTAADIWLVAAVGMAVGVGWFGVAIFTAIMGAIALVALRPVSRAVAMMGTTAASEPNATAAMADRATRLQAMAKPRAKQRRR